MCGLVRGVVCVEVYVPVCLWWEGFVFVRENMVGWGGACVFVCM